MAELATDQAKDTPTRRSTRLRAKRDKDSTQQVSTNDGGSVPTKGRPDESPVVKRRKSVNVRKPSGPRRFSKKGRLQPLVNMPIEIIGEIASHLRPVDLLTLARSCKFLRDFFMSRGTAPIWKASRDAIGLPDCPSDLSEPQYADLLFFKGCYLCLAPRAQILRIPFRVRLCKSCDEENLLDFSDVSDSHRTKHAPVMLGDAEQEKFLDLLPYVDEDSCGSSSCKEHRVMYAPQIADLLRKEEKMTDQEWDTYVEENGPKIEALNKHARAVEKWIERDEGRKKMERISLVVDRKILIFDRLRSKPGCSEDQLVEHPLEDQASKRQWKKLISDPKPVTDRIWKNIEPKLLAIMTERKKLVAQYGSADDLVNYILDGNYDSDNDFSDEYDDYYDDDLDGPDWWPMFAGGMFAAFGNLGGPVGNQWSEDEDDDF